MGPRIITGSGEAIVRKLDAYLSLLRGGATAGDDRKMNNKPLERGRLRQGGASGGRSGSQEARRLSQAAVRQRPHPRRADQPIL